MLARLPSPPALRIHPVALSFLVAAGLVAFDNGALWAEVWRFWPGRAAHDYAFFVSIALFLTAALGLFLMAVAWPRAQKPILIALLLAASAVSYFSDAYGVVVDRGMIANVLQTDAGEAADLFSFALVVRVALLGVLPSLLIVRAEIAPLPWRRELALRGGAAVGVVALVGLIAALFFQDYASLIRNDRKVQHLVNPVAPLAAATKYAAQALIPEAPPAPRRLAANVARGASWAKPSNEKALLVIVVGETARADRFALNGYERPTNPELSKKPVISFANVRSCGTATAVSVPCMFSPLGRADFSGDAARRTENLLELLARAGFDASWIDNNAGCKGVCDRIPTQSAADHPSRRDDGSRDEILVDMLKAKLAAGDRDMVVALHQMGSHGPAYYKRYPERFRVFQPTCDTNQIQSCSDVELGNAYDDTILYADHVLAETIAALEAASDRYDAAMIYVSDHGESLGEGGVYLHGLPYMFAPEAQTHVPMILWTSPGYRERFGIDAACLAARRDAPLSHDNLFHSVLGLLDVGAEFYDSALDLVAPCKAGRS